MSGSAEVLSAIKELTTTKQLDRSELLDLLRDGIHAAPTCASSWNSTS